MKRVVLLVIGYALFACAGVPQIPLPEINNIEADENEKLARDPELAWHLDALKVPSDDRWHFGANVKRLHDRQTGAAIGWYFSFNAKHAIPFVVRSSPTPIATSSGEDPDK